MRALGSSWPGRTTPHVTTSRNPIPNQYRNGGVTVTSYPQQFPYIGPKQRCWSCDDRRAREDGLGLCSECRDRLIEEGRDGR